MNSKTTVVINVAPGAHGLFELAAALFHPRELYHLAVEAERIAARLLGQVEGLEHLSTNQPAAECGQLSARTNMSGISNNADTDRIRTALTAMEALTVRLQAAKDAIAARFLALTAAIAAAPDLATVQSLATEAEADLKTLGETEASIEALGTDPNAAPAETPTGSTAAAAGDAPAAEGTAGS